MSRPEESVYVEMDDTEEREALRAQHQRRVAVGAVVFLILFVVLAITFLYVHNIGLTDSQIRRSH